MCHGLLVHFAHNASYVSLFTMGLTKLPVNNIKSQRFVKQIHFSVSFKSNVINNKIKVKLTSFQKPQASKLFSGVGLTS